MLNILDNRRCGVLFEDDIMPETKSECAIVPILLQKSCLFLG